MQWTATLTPLDVAGLIGLLWLPAVWSPVDRCVSVVSSCLRLLSARCVSVSPSEPTVSSDLTARQPSCSARMTVFTPLGEVRIWRERVCSLYSGMCRYRISGIFKLPIEPFRFRAPKPWTEDDRYSNWEWHLHLHLDLDGCLSQCTLHNFCAVLCNNLYSFCPST